MLPLLRLSVFLVFRLFYYQCKRDFFSITYQGGQCWLNVLPFHILMSILEFLSVKFVQGRLSAWLQLHPLWCLLNYSRKNFFFQKGYKDCQRSLVFIKDIQCIRYTEIYIIRTDNACTNKFLWARYFLCLCCDFF